MDSIINGLIDSVGKYFSVFSIFFRKSPAVFFFLFKPEKFRKFKQDTFGHTFLIYTVLCLYLIFDVLLFRRQDTPALGLTMIFDKIQQTLQLRSVLIFIVVFSLVMEILTYLFTCGRSRRVRQILRRFVRYTFSFEIIGFLLFFTLPLFFEDYLGDLVTTVWYKLVLLFFFSGASILVYKLFFKKIAEAIELAGKRAILNRRQTRVFTLFIWVPIIVTYLLVEYVIPSERREKTYVAHFIDSEDPAYAAVDISSDSGGNAIGFRFILENNTEASIPFDTTAQFYLSTLVLGEDTSVLKGFNPHMVVDSIDLSICNPPNSMFFKKKDIMMFRICATEHNRFIEKLLAGVGHVKERWVVIRMRSIYKNSVIIYNGNASLSLNSVVINPLVK